MSVFPLAWRDASIGEVCDLNPREVAPPDPATLVSFVPMPAVSDVAGTILDHGTRPFSEVAKGYTRFRDGDVIFAKITPCMENGKIAVARGLTGGFACGSTEFHVLRSRGSILPEYLWHFLRQQSFRMEAERHMAGAVGQRRVPAQYLRDTTIPLPPLDEQRRIVAKLDDLLARSRSARDELARIPRLVGRYKQAVLAAAYSGEMTRQWRDGCELPRPALLDQQGIDGRAIDLHLLPNNWVWTALGRITRVAGGLTKNSKRETIATRVPYLRVANVYANDLRLDDVVCIGCTDAEFAKTRLEEGDLLIVEGNGSIEQIGRVAIWGGEIVGCSHQNHLIRARPGPHVLPRFVLYWLLSPGGRSAIESVASSSSGLHTLSVSKVEGLPIPLCSIEEQEQIVKRLDTAFARIATVASEQRRATALLDRLDQATLARAFRGALVPQEAVL